MVSLVLSVALLTSSGGLLADKTPAVGLLLGAASYEGAPLELMSVPELTAERARLQESMPSLGLGITLTAVGGGVLLTGLVIMAAAVFVEVLLVGLLVTAAAIPLLIIGPIQIGRAARERRDHMDRIRWIDQRLASFNRESLEGPPPNNEVPPPPPMRPPGSWLPNTVPQVLLATF